MLFIICCIMFLTLKFLPIFYGFQRLLLSRQKLLLRSNSATHNILEVGELWRRTDRHTTYIVFCVAFLHHSEAHCIWMIIDKDLFCFQRVRVSMVCRPVRWVGDRNSRCAKELRNRFSVAELNITWAVFPLLLNVRVCIGWVGKE
jgi:hypothetical protein